MEVFLGSIATGEYESMASALIQMGATNTDVDSRAFARDLEKIFSSIQACIVFIRTCRYPCFKFLPRLFCYVLLLCIREKKKLML